MRCYSFEDSISLYKERIRNAHQRFGNETILNAEKEHCKKRIAQLRRSYYIQYGWESFRIESSSEALRPEDAGELSAFLRSTFAVGDLRPAIELNVVRQNESEHIFATQVGEQQYLLYMHWTLEEYSKFCLQQLSSSEKILFKREGEDVFLSLIGSGEVELPQMAEDLLEEEILIAVNHLKWGDLLEGLAHFVALYQHNPYNRSAYWGASIVYEKVGAYAEEEMTLRMAVHYFTDDPAFLLRYAAVLIRRSADEAVSILHRAKSNGASPKQIEFLRCFAYIQQGSYIKARRYLEKKQNRAKLSKSQRRTALYLLHLLRFRAFCRLSFLFVLALSLNGVLMGLSLLWILFAATILLFPILHIFWSRRYQRFLTGETGSFYSLLPSSDFQKIRTATDAH
ncbi:MAG: hypothetical protein VX278_20250 [Myxococcota bacterium]|nr:hypothetical protein [Myxococcota bacterium]